MSLKRDSYPIPGSTRSIEVFTLRGREDGPVLGVTGSVHGDELEGPLALSRLLAEFGDGEGIRGTLVVVPISNPEAVAAAVRCTPADGLNLARTFPGRAGGSITEEIAALLTEHVLTKITHFIDLHSAAVASACPLFAGYCADPAVGAVSREMALAFGAPVVWRHNPPVSPGRTLSVTYGRGVPSIYLEATGGVTPPEEVISAYADGVKRVMAYLGMIPPMTEPARPVFLVGDGNTDNPTCQAPERGLIERHVEPLDEVAADTLCFTLRDLDGSVLREIRPGVAGVATFVRRSRWVEAGQLLIAVAERDTQEGQA